MKKLIALLVAMMMLFSCMSALAEEPAQDAALLAALQIPDFTVTYDLQVNEEAVAGLLAAYGMDEQSAAIVNMLLPLFEDMSEKAVFANNGVQYDLKIKDQDILSLVAEENENGLALATDLLPSYVLTIKNETIAKLVEEYFKQAEEVAGKLDMELIQKAYEKLFGYAMELVGVYQTAVSFGEPVKGEYADLIEGVVFNTEIPLNVDVNAMIAAIKAFCEKVAADESIAGALNSIASMVPGMNVDLSQLAAMEIPEEYIPEVSGVVYTITDDEGNQTAVDTYVVVSAVGKNDDSGNSNTYVYVSEASVDVLVEVPAQEISFECYVELIENGYTMNYAIVAPGIDAEIAAVVTMTDTGMAADAALYMNEIEAPILTCSAEFAFGGERTKTAFDGEKAELPLEGLLDGTASSEVIGALAMDAKTNGLPFVLNNIKTVLPEQGAMLEEMVNQILTMFMGGAEEVPAA